MDMKVLAVYNFSQPQVEKYLLYYNVPREGVGSGRESGFYMPKLRV